jgi:hypothetical protein
MIRRSVAGAILGISLLMGSFAWSGFVALRTVFDADRSRDVAQELFDNDQVRAQLAENTAFAVRSIIPRQVPVDDALIDQVTAELLENPVVEETILTAFAGTHAAFLGEGDAPETIDLSELAEEARASLVAAAPELDGVLPASPILSVPLPTEHVPDASPVSGVLDKAVPVLAGLAVLGALLALMATTDRPAILRRAGFWALGTTAVYLIIGIGIPYLLRQYAPDQAEVLAALLAALLRSTLLPSIVLGGIGVALFAVAAMWSAATAGRGGRRQSKPKRAPYPDAPHRREVAGTASTERGNPPVVRDNRSPDPYARPRAGPAPRQALPAQPLAYRPPRTSPEAVPQSGSPAPRGAEQSRGPREAVPTAPAVTPTASPYPDAAHYECIHADPAPYKGPDPDPDAPGATAAPSAAEPVAPRSRHSIFDDVPIPQVPTRATNAAPQTVQPPPVAIPLDDNVAPAPDTSRSVFADSGESNEHAAYVEPASSAPPAGARWHGEHGWVLDPESTKPLPAEAIWVEGVGYVVPPARRD